MNRAFALCEGPFLCIYPAVLHFQDIYDDFPPDKSIFFSVN